MRKLLCCFALLFIMVGCKDDSPNAQPTPDPVPGKPFTNSIGMKLVYIPPGEFMMGSPSSERKRESDEGPVHRVTITTGFHMSTTEVTQAQYEQLRNDNPSHFKGQDNPVEKVSWNDAMEFCKKLSEKEGKQYRLPTEAEWEYACRAGTTTPFHTGETISTSQANYNGNYVYGNGTKGVFRKRTISVGSFPPNAFGLYDMHGNVWEWCSDWYNDRYYSISPNTDPTGPSTGSYRVLRGGCWYNGANYCRVAYRSRYYPLNRFNGTPYHRHINYGFRVCLDLN